MSRILRLLALLVALAVLAPAQQAPTPTQDASLDLNGYLAELDRWSAAAARLKAHPEEAAALRKNLPQTWPVTIGGQHFSVPTDWLRNTLTSLESNGWLAGDYSKEMQTRLKAMRDEAEAFDRKSTLRPDEARNKLDEILKRREFRQVRGPTWFELLRERVLGWLADLLSRVFGRLRGHPALTNILLWGFLVALTLAFLVWLVRSFLSRPVGPALGLKGAILTRRTSRDWGREALAAAERGNYRDAIRFAYWAGVYRLEELGLWQIDPARTHREYLRLLSDAQAQRLPFRTIASRFESVWYGGQAASLDDFRSVVAQLETLGCQLHWTSFHLTTGTGNS